MNLLPTSSNQIFHLLNMKLTIAAIIGTAVLLYSKLNQPDPNIELHIRGIKTNIGSIRIAIFTDEKGFKKEKAYKKIRMQKFQTNNLVLTTKFYLKPGTYGVSLLDDKNDNGKMDYNFVGIPKEGFAFADYYHKGLSKPKFKDFSFVLKDDSSLLMQAKFRYM